VILLVVLGIIGFTYRQSVEKPLEIACTQEARICPDGSAVGRSGPSCEFETCAYPNVEVKEHSLAFVAPAGYVAGSSYEGVPSHIQSELAVYKKSAPTSSTTHYITVSSIALSASTTAKESIMQNTVFQPADMVAEDMSRFTPVTIGGKEGYFVTLERFEALVHSRYYFPREKEVLLFDVIEQEVTNWTDPNLVITDLPEHKALKALLELAQF